MPARRQAPEADREEAGRVDGLGGLRLPLAPRKPRPAAGLSLRKYATRTSRASSRSGSARPTTLRRRWRFGRRSRAGNTASARPSRALRASLTPKTKAAVKNPPVFAIPRARSARVGPALALSEKRLGMSGERRGVLGKAKEAPTLLLLRTAQRFASIIGNFSRRVLYDPAARRNLPRLRSRPSTSSTSKIPGLAVPPVTATRTGWAILPSARFRSLITFSNAFWIEAVSHGSDVELESVRQFERAAVATPASGTSPPLSDRSRDRRRGSRMRDRRARRACAHARAACHHLRDPVVRKPRCPRASRKGFTSRTSRSSGKRLHVVGIDPGELVEVEDAGRFPDVLDREQLQELRRSRRSPDRRDDQPSRAR